MAKRPKKPETNVEFVTRLMEWSKHGPLAQVFVITAIEKYAETVADSPPIEHGLINGELWKAIAQEFKTELDAKYRA